MPKKGMSLKRYTPSFAYSPRRPSPAAPKEFTHRASVTAPPKTAFSRLPVFAQGDRVKHMLFGIGEILSVRQMGADTLYEIRFENGTVKKLMATYAKLTKA